MLIYLGWILLLGFSFDILSFAETWKAVSKYKYNLFFLAQKPPARNRAGQALTEQPQVWNSGIEGNVINSTMVIATSMSHISKVMKPPTECFSLPYYSFETECGKQGVYLTAKTRTAHSYVIDKLFKNKNTVHNPLFWL